MAPRDLDLGLEASEPAFGQVVGEGHMLGPLRKGQHLPGTVPQAFSQVAGLGLLGPLSPGCWAKPTATP